MNLQITSATLVKAKPFQPGEILDDSNSTMDDRREVNAAGKGVWVAVDAPKPKADPVAASVEDDADDDDGINPIDEAPKTRRGRPKKGD